MTVTHKYRTQVKRYQHGQVLVEAALTAVVFFLLMFGIVVFSQLTRANEWVSHAAREGTRYAIVHGADSLSPATQDSIRTYLLQQFVAFDPAKLTVTATWPEGNEPGRPVTVQVQYVSDPLIPFVVSTSVTLHSTSTMLISN